ncbi:MAG: N-acetyltransferase family protein [Pseudobdellovibrionaceae bacterium]
MNFEIRLATLNDIDAYSKHCIFNLSEKGIDNSFVHPYPGSYCPDISEYSANIENKWNKEPFSPNWEIAWVAIVNGKIVGHLDMRCGGIEALVHRMRLGMGIENGFRSVGIGTHLLKAALNWAKDQNKISWIDLSVFENNHAARSLYKKYGFKEIFLIEDALRIENESINDVQMTLRLK